MCGEGGGIGKFYYYTHRPYFIVVVIVVTSSHSICHSFIIFIIKFAVLICQAEIATFFLLALSARNWHRFVLMYRDLHADCCLVLEFFFSIFF